MKIISMNYPHADKFLQEGIQLIESNQFQKKLIFEYLDDIRIYLANTDTLRLFLQKLSIFSYSYIDDFNQDELSKLSKNLSYIEISSELSTKLFQKTLQHKCLYLNLNNLYLDSISNDDLKEYLIILNHQNSSQFNDIYITLIQKYSSVKNLFIEEYKNLFSNSQQFIPQSQFNQFIFHQKPIYFINNPLFSNSEKIEFINSQKNLTPHTFENLLKDKEFKISSDNQNILEAIIKKIILSDDYELDFLFLGFKNNDIKKILADTILNDSELSSFVSKKLSKKTSFKLNEQFSNFNLLQTFIFQSSNEICSKLIKNSQIFFDIFNKSIIDNTDIFSYNISILDISIKNKPRNNLFLTNLFLDLTSSKKINKQKEKVCAITFYQIDKESDPMIYKNLISKLNLFPENMNLKYIKKMKNLLSDNKIDEIKTFILKNKIENKLTKKSPKNLNKI